MLWRARDFKVSFGKRSKVLIMGILNITPDSFSDGNCYLKCEDAYERAGQMVRDGADIIDIGAESTQPGARPISAAEELNRILPVLAKIKKKFSIPISIDTTKYEVAAEALRQGAAIINDISGLQQSPDIGALVKKYNAGLVLMHMRGTPVTMQDNTQYKDLVPDMVKELSECMQRAKVWNVPASQIVIDPGIGFSKTVDQNIEILNRLHAFARLRRPILIGTSRKSFIGKTLGRDVHERLAGTLASIASAVHQGAQIVRVHDVRETKDFLTMLQKCGTYKK